MGTGLTFNLQIYQFLGSTQNLKVLKGIISIRGQNKEHLRMCISCVTLIKQRTFQEWDSKMFVLSFTVFQTKEHFALRKHSYFLLLMGSFKEL